MKYLSSFHWNGGEDGAMDTYECSSVPAGKADTERRGKVLFLNLIECEE